MKLWFLHESQMHTIERQWLLVDMKNEWTVAQAKDIEPSRLSFSPAISGECYQSLTHCRIMQARTELSVSFQFVYCWARLLVAAGARYSWLSLCAKRCLYLSLSCFSHFISLVFLTFSSLFSLYLYIFLSLPFFPSYISLAFFLSLLFYFNPSRSLFSPSPCSSLEASA